MWSVHCNTSISDKNTPHPDPTVIPEAQQPHRPFCGDLFPIEEDASPHTSASTTPQNATGSTPTNLSFISSQSPNALVGDVVVADSNMCMLSPKMRRLGDFHDYAVQSSSPSLPEQSTGTEPVCDAEKCAESIGVFETYANGDSPTSWSVSHGQAPSETFANGSQCRPSSLQGTIPLLSSGTGSERRSNQHTPVREPSASMPPSAHAGVSAHNALMHSADSMQPDPAHQDATQSIVLPAHIFIGHTNSFRPTLQASMRTADLVIPLHACSISLPQVVQTANPRTSDPAKTLGLTHHAHHSPGHKTNLTLSMPAHGCHVPTQTPEIDTHPPSAPPTSPQEALFPLCRRTCESWQSPRAAPGQRAGAGISEEM